MYIRFIFILILFSFSSAYGEESLPHMAGIPRGPASYVLPKPMIQTPKKALKTQIISLTSDISDIVSFGIGKKKIKLKPLRTRKLGGGVGFLIKF